MTPPTISVVLPVRNGARFLAEAIDSALAQTLPPTEIVVVDNGSTDATPEVIASFGPPVVALHEERPGVATARNLGIRRSTGELIAFLDHDDRWPPDNLAAHVAAFAERPSAQAVRGRIRVVGGRIPGRAASGGDDVLHRGPHLGAVVVRRSFFEETGLLDHTVGMADDFELYRRLEDLGQECVEIDTVALEYRWHGDNNTSALVDEQGLGMLNALKRSLDRRRGQTGP